MPQVATHLINQIRKPPEVKQVGQGVALKTSVKHQLAIKVDKQQGEEAHHLVVQ